MFCHECGKGVPETSTLCECCNATQIPALLRAEPSQKLGELAERDLQCVRTDEEVPEIARLMSDFNLTMLPVVDDADTHWRILEQLGELRDLGRVEMSSHAHTRATGRSRSFSPRTTYFTLGHEMARTSNSPQQQSRCLAHGATITARWTTQPHPAQMISISSDPAPPGTDPLPPRAPDARPDARGLLARSGRRNTNSPAHRAAQLHRSRAQSPP